MDNLLLYLAGGLGAVVLALVPFLILERRKQQREGKDSLAIREFNEALEKKRRADTEAKPARKGRRKGK